MPKYQGLSSHHDDSDRIVMMLYFSLLSGQLIKTVVFSRRVGIIQKQNIGNAIGLNGFGNIFCIISRVDHDDSCIVRNQERNKTVCVGILEDHQHLFGFGSGIDNDFRMIAAKEYIVLAFGGQALNVKYRS